ncbi:hypothetical protein BBC27_09580 [Acidithiobacillus ferrivorans]|uniref:Uncharacterized protein n=1 Tax=Acidithiobacillus ferrivorans TaxID=160808 RepID=A0A1B9BZJ7_9PROT|nr:hypothetical protein [Acidithiobacillus ferrivorans]OCB03090.1 hypothetical protein BBC27_09580 [Acidithiobacillus ferrivorans]
MMTASTIQMTIDRDGLYASLIAAADHAKYLDPTNLSPEDQEFAMAANLLQAAMTRIAAKHVPKTACTLTYRDMAEAVRKRNPNTKPACNCRPETLRNIQVFQYLDDNDLGDGVGYQTNLKGKINTKFSALAVESVATHYPKLLFENGWK